MVRHRRRKTVKDVFDGRNARLVDFVDVRSSGGEKRSDDLPSTCSEKALVLCPKCGKPENVIKRGTRITKFRGYVQRYECKICRVRFVFTPYIRMRWPDWIYDVVLDAKVTGLTDLQIAKAVLAEARRQNEKILISPKSVSNIVKRALKILREFERYAPRKENAATWQIDDTPQPFSGNKKSVKGNTDPKSHHDFLWITNILQEENRYWYSDYVSDNRSYMDSEIATRLALQRAKYGPQLVKCDGYRGHVKGVGKTLRHVEIISKTKKEDYGWINRIERLHQTMRSLAVKKKRHFRSIKSLADTVEIVRIFYNFLRPNEALGGSTPARKAGVDYPWHEGLTWSELIRFAFNFLRKQRRSS